MPPDQEVDPLPTPPRDAATVVVVRDGPRGLELFCVERHRGSAFMGGALVFPGGKVDPDDRHDAWATSSTPLGARCHGFAESPRVARAFAIAALREALEEAAILPVVGDALSADGAAALRERLLLPDAPAFSAAVRELGLVVDTARLEALSRWVTPVVEPRRFDTRFYLLALPDGQQGRHDERETTSGFWATPDEILARWERGEAQLAPPTSFTIGLFRGARDVQAARAVARRTSLAPIRPCFVQDAGQMVLVLAGDPLYPDPVEDAEPIGTTRFVLSGGRFVSVSSRG